MYLFTNMNRVIECKQVLEHNPSYDENSLWYAGIIEKEQMVSQSAGV